MQLRALIAAPLLAIVMIGAAHACPPPPPVDPPPPGESVEAWQARLEAEAHARVVSLQQRWWNDSQSVLLARVERTETITLRNEYGEAYGHSPRVTMRPIRWLKGEGSVRRFRLNYTGLTDCGPYGGGEAVDGHVGDVFVVFVRDGAPRAESVSFSLALGNVVDERLQARVRGGSAD